MTYAEQLKDPRWQKVRLFILMRDDFTCVACGCKTKELQVHHGVYIKGLKPWEYEGKHLHSLCVDCHELTGKFMKEIYQKIGEINPKTLWDIEWFFDSVKKGNAEEIRKWIIETENKTVCR